MLLRTWPTIAMVVYKMPQKSYEREDYFGRIYKTLMMMKSTVIGRWYTIGGQTIQGCAAARATNCIAT